MWYDSMQNAIKQTIIISEILDTRTRHLIQVCMFANVLAAHHAGNMCPAQQALGGYKRSAAVMHLNEGPESYMMLKLGRL